MVSTLVGLPIRDILFHRCPVLSHQTYLLFTAVLLRIIFVFLLNIIKQTKIPLIIFAITYDLRFCNSTMLTSERCIMLRAVAHLQRGGVSTPLDVKNK